MSVQANTLQRLHTCAKRGGHGISQDKKTKEWGVAYGQVDGTGENAGQAVSRFQTQGSRPENIDETTERVVGDMQQFQFEKDNKIVSQTETGWIRNVDGSSIDEPMSGMARLHSLANALSITSYNTAPGVLKVPGVSNTSKAFQKIGGRTNAEWADLFKWGKRPQEALNALNNFSKKSVQSLKDAGVELKDVKQRRQAYENALEKKTTNTTAEYRLELMDAIINLW